MGLSFSIVAICNLVVRLLWSWPALGLLGPEGSRLFSHGHFWQHSEEESTHPVIQIKEQQMCKQILCH